MNNMESIAKLSDEEIAENYIRSVMPAEKAKEILNILPSEKILSIKNRIEKIIEEKRRWDLAAKEGRLGEMVAEFNMKSEILMIMSEVFSPDQVENAKMMLDQVDDERQLWERARKEGRLQEMVDAYNKASLSGELSAKDKGRCWYSGLWQ